MDFAVLGFALFQKIQILRNRSVYRPAYKSDFGKYYFEAFSGKAQALLDSGHGGGIDSGSGRLFLSLRTHHGVLFSRNSSVSHMEETGDLCAGSGGCHRIFPTLFLCSFSHGCAGRGCSWYSLRNPGNSMYEKAERHKSGKILLI